TPEQILLALEAKSSCLVDADQRIVRHEIQRAGITPRAIPFVREIITLDRREPAGELAQGRPFVLTRGAARIGDDAAATFRPLPHRCRIAGGSQRFRGAADAQATSNKPAAPMPPPMHIVTTTYLTPRRLPSSRAWPASRVPDTPSGWPTAIAPPSTLRRSYAMPSLSRQ